MKCIVTALVLSVSLLLASGSVGYAQDFRKGIEAVKRGDYATALREWRPLAEQGHANAQFNLGVLYANGHGVPQNKAYAHMWLNISAQNGHEHAARFRDIVANAMTQSDISKAKELARECVRKNYKDC